MTYQDLLVKLSAMTQEQLNNRVVALIDNEPWECDRLEIAHDDEDFQDSPYLVFEN